MGARANSISRITRLRRRAAFVLWMENIFRAAAPGCAILAVYVALALFGFGNPWLFAMVLCLAGLAFGFGFAKLRRPAGETIDRRIESASGLWHRPLSVLDDAPESGSALALEIWTAHQRRVTAMLDKARAGILAPQAVAHDHFALRWLLLLLLLSGAVLAGPAAPGRLLDALALPQWPFTGPIVTGWITPPGYAGQPPHVLAPGEAVTVLPGSALTIITDGSNHAPPARLGETKFTGSDLSPTSHRVDAVLNQSGRLTVGPWWHRLAAWNIQIVPPGAPVIHLTSIELSKGAKITLKFNITDAYGLAAASARFVPAGHAAALLLAFSLPLNTGDSIAAFDLTNSPYHDLPVNMVLTARNIAGVSGSEDTRNLLILPGLPLHDKTALALDHGRQDLALTPQNMLAMSSGFQKLAARPPSAITMAADVQLAYLASQMAAEQIDAQNAVDRLLALIKEIEAGPAFAADQALSAANQALLQALRGGTLNQTDLNKLLQAVDAALAQKLTVMAAPQTLPGAQQLGSSALDQLAQKIAADEVAGRTAQAATELQQLQQMMAALQSATPMTAAQAAQTAAAGKAAEAIAQMLQGEAALLNKTDNGDAMPADQAGLRNQLNSAAKGLAKAGLNLPGLGRAGTAMGEAESALGQHDYGDAGQNETGAIRGLQQAAAALVAAQRGNFSIGQSGQPTAWPNDAADGLNGAPNEQSDPALSFSSGDAARAIQMRIMKQDAAPGLPVPTRQYYQNLLNQDGQ